MEKNLEIKNNYYVYILLNNLKPGRYSYKGLDRSFLFEPFYVGKGKNNRVLNHFKKFDRHNPHKSHTIKQIKTKLNLDPFYLYYSKNLSEIDALNLEIKIIEIIGKRKEKNGPLTNITIGGTGGVTCSKEFLQEQSQKYWSNEDNRIKKSQESSLMWGNINIRNKILENRYITINTEEYKEKMSNSTRGEKNPNSKLSKKQVLGILNLLANGWLPAHIVKLFNIRINYIDELKRGATWKFLINEYPELFEKIKKFYRVKFNLNPKQIKNILYLRKKGMRIKEISKALKLKYSSTRRLITDFDRIPYINILKGCNLI